MKNFVMSLTLLVSGFTYAQTSVDFLCKDSFNKTIEETSGVNMVKLNSIESAKGAFYEAIMGQDSYLKAMEETYAEINEQNKNNASMQVVFDFEKFETPINTILKKINRPKGEPVITYSEIAQILLSNVNNDRFCPSGRAMNLNQMIKEIKKDI